MLFYYTYLLIIHRNEITVFCAIVICFYYFSSFCLYYIIYLYLLEQIFTEIRKLREQVKEVHGILKQSCTPNSVMPTCNDVPADFPLKTHEELRDLENYLNSRENRNALVCYIKLARVLQHIYL